MRIGLIGNAFKDPHYQVAKEVVSKLRALGAVPCTDEQLMEADFCTLEGMELAPFSSCHLLLSLGGDGTLLAAAHYGQPYALPIVGINLGSLGFLTDIDVDQMDQLLPRLVQGDFQIEERMLIGVEKKLGEGWESQGFAVNDVVLNRAPLCPIVHYQVILHGEEVEIIPGDGIIVSTPNGSTGYAMAAGGPIIEPSLEAMLMTPLCPHTLHRRSYVLQASSVLELRVEKASMEVNVSVDGRNNFALQEGESVRIRKYDHPLRLVQMEPQNFYRKLPQKIQARSLHRGQREG